MAKAGATNAYTFGKTVAKRYAAYPNIVWHVMGDFPWSYNQGPGGGLDAIYHGIKDTEGTTHRLNIAEPANGSTSFDQFISEEGPNGYQWFKQSADTVYDYGSNSVEQFDKVYNRAGAMTYPVVDIEPPYVNAPHYKGQQNQERANATMRRSSAVCRDQLWPRKVVARHGVTGLFDGGPDWLNIIREPPQRCTKFALGTFSMLYVYPRQILDA